MYGEAPHRSDIVLVVDDSPESLTLIIEAIEASGMTALVARDGASALTLVERVMPDLVLLDAVMPGIDGFETCRRLKSRPAAMGIPVIFMTGLTDSAHVLEGLRAGSVDYLTKPISPDELVARISIHLANARMIEDARLALDASGQSVLALKADGSVGWASRGARDALEALLGGRPVEALRDEPALARWVATMQARAISETRELDLEAVEGRGVRLTVIGRSAAGDLLARVTRLDREPPEILLSRELGLTLREGEVLFWLCEGKSNRDIAAILGLSPRTVMKHVEQLFAKIEVENRTAAASVALRKLFR